MPSPLPTAPAPESRAAANGCALIARNAFPFLVVGAIWEIVARSGIFPRKLFPTLEDVARAFCRPHRFRHPAASRHRDGAAPALRLRPGRRHRAHHRRADGALAAGRGHLPAAGLDPGADPRPRLHAAVPALVRTRRILRRAAGRLRVDVSGDLQLLDRGEGGEGNLAALGAGHGRRQRAASSATSSCPARCPISSPACGSAWRRPGASWWRWRCSPPCPGGSAG